MIAKVENGQELLESTDFLQIVTTDLINMLRDYFDSVRDAACVLLEFVVTNLLRKSVVKDSDRAGLLRMLQASSGMGWSDSMHGPCRDAAEAEATYI